MSEYKDLVYLAAILVGLLAPLLMRLCSRLLIWARPRPGTYSLESKEIGMLTKGFMLDRGSIALATVPEHINQAKPAASTRSIDLGDATLVIPKAGQRLLRAFISKPRARKKTRDSIHSHIEDDILIITGEPGAGKSVLLQELHATLSLGVEKGQHSFIPLFVFARDITLDSIEKASKDADNPVRSLVVAQYERRSSDPANEELRYIANFVKYHWEEKDYLVIIDGLDEIAQRSSYEDIQRLLAQAILKDLKTDLPRVHRYILSCRVDEDLELFPSAQSLFLRGLGDKERERFCRALIGMRVLEKQTKASLQEALKSSRLTPTHVFRRNPYFLSLLVRHVREDQDRVRDRTIDFDLLMRKYLEREAIRPYASVDSNDLQSTDRRREIFRELEGVSRACLQYIAFRSASSARTGSLYDETPIDASLIFGFIEALQSAKETSAGSLWSTLYRFGEACLNPHRPAGLSAESIHKLGLTEHLHENDIRLLYSLSDPTNGSHGLDERNIEEALGTIPYRGKVETSDWYREFLYRFSLITSKANPHPNPRELLAIMIFVRSIAAAHVLRILNVSLGKSSIGIRFRHRRLAEYYAACYIRDRWPTLKKTLVFSPWLGPVINLTCALEGSPCRALTWLVDRIPIVPSEPYFEWRYSVEAAVEASFFAQPGPAYTKALKNLTHKLIDALGVHSTRPEHKHSNAVTQIVLLRSLEQIGLLKTTLPQEGVLDTPTREAFYKYESRIPAEWIAPLLPARLAIRSLSGKPHPLSHQLGTMWRIIQQPSGVLFSNFRMRWTGLALLRTTAILSTIVSEISGLLLFVAIISGVIFLLATSFEAEHDVALDAVRMVALVLTVSYIVLRLLAWQQSPTKAAAQAASLWRISTSVLHALKKPRWGMAIKFVGSFVLLMGLVLGVAAIWPEPRPEPPLQPCPDIGKQIEEIARRFTGRIAKAGTIGQDGIADLQEDLRRDLESLREANRVKQCGYETEEGWELAEERAADWLAEYDPRLVPSPSNEEPLALTLHEVHRLERRLAEPPPELPRNDFIGSLAAIQRSRKIDQTVDELRALRSTIINARREGIGVPVAADNAPVATNTNAARPDITLSIKLEERITTALKKHKPVQTELRKRTKRALVHGTVILVALGMSLLLMRAYWRRRIDKGQLASLSQERSIAALCNFLLERSYSERVRLGAIRRIDLLGVGNHNDLQIVERAVGLLLSRRSETERNLGINAAALVRVLSNRLRHRMTTDAPLKKVAR